MKQIDRLTSVKKSLWKALFKTYMILGFPCALFISIPSAFMAPSLISEGAYSTLSFFVFIWMGVLLPLLYIVAGRKYRAHKINQMVTMLSRPDRFSPQKQHQVLDAGRGKYLGIDTKNGTILYIHMVKKGLIDVIGLDMQSWTNRELEGSALRLYTKMPDVPVLSVYAHPIVAKRLFDTLGAMDQNSYCKPFTDSWPVYVAQQSRFVEYEHDVVVPQAV